MPGDWSKSLGNPDEWMLLNVGDQVSQLVAEMKSDEIAEACAKQGCDHVVPSVKRHGNIMEEVIPQRIYRSEWTRTELIDGVHSSLDHFENPASSILSMGMSGMEFIQALIAFKDYSRAEKACRAMLEKPRVTNRRQIQARHVFLQEILGDVGECDREEFLGTWCMGEEQTDGNVYVITKKEGIFDFTQTSSACEVKGELHHENGWERMDSNLSYTVWFKMCKGRCVSISQHNKIPFHTGEPSLATSVGDKPVPAIPSSWTASIMPKVCEVAVSDTVHAEEGKSGMPASATPPMEGNAQSLAQSFYGMTVMPLAPMPEADVHSEEGEADDVGTHSSVGASPAMEGIAASSAAEQDFEATDSALHYEIWQPEDMRGADAEMTLSSVKKGARRSKSAKGHATVEPAAAEPTAAEMAEPAVSEPTAAETAETEHAAVELEEMDSAVAEPATPENAAEAAVGEPEAAETVTAEVEASTVEEREAAALVTEARIEEVVNRIFAKGFTAAIAGTAEISRPLADGGEDDAEDASMARVAEADTKATADDEVAADYEAEQTMQDWPASYLEPAAQGNADEQAMQDWPASFLDFDALDN